MSNSSSDSFQLIKEDQNEIDFENTSPPIANHSDGYPKTFSNQILDQVLENHQEQRGGVGSNNNASLDQEQEEKRDDINENDQEITKKMELGKSEVAEDDEGLKTPTSLDHRIPVLTECPPAPRKRRPTSPPPPPFSRKRTISWNVVKLDFPREVESFFPTIIREDLNKKMKKSSDDDDDDANK